MPKKKTPAMTTLAEDVKAQVDGDIAKLVEDFQGQFTSDRSPVSREKYLAYRRESWDDPKARQQWVAQVGPEAFYKEFFEAFDVPKDVSSLYLESVKAGLTHEKATFYADSLHAAERSPLVQAPPLMAPGAPPLPAPPPGPPGAPLVPPQLVVGPPPAPEAPPLA